MGRWLVLAAALVAAAMAGCAAKLGPADAAPLAALDAEFASGPPRLVLDASGSSDPEGKPLSYHWNWFLGQAQTSGPRLEVPLPAELAGGNATLPVTVVVTDPFGGSAWAASRVTVGTRTSPGVSLAFETWPRWVEPGSILFFDAQRSRDLESGALTFEWLWGPRGVREPIAAVAPRPADCTARSASGGPEFDAGCLSKGEHVELSFDAVGTYDFTCSIHPWMRGRVVANDTAPAGGASTIEVAGFAFQPTNLTIGVGANVTFLNRDPLKHAPAADAWTPAIRAGGDAPQLQLTPAEGDYVVRLTVENAKGDRVVKSWGARVATDAPPNPQDELWTAANDDGGRQLGPGQSWTRGWFNLSWQAHVQAQLNYTDAGRGFSAFPTSGDVALGTMAGDAFQPVANCPSSYFAPGTAVPPRFLINCDVPPGSYVFRVSSGSSDGQAVLLDWRLAASADLATFPAFGDLPARATIAAP